MNITELVNNKKEIQLWPVTERTGAIIAYRKILMEVVRALQVETRATILPAYRSALTLDMVMDEASWFERLKSIAETIIYTAIGKMRTLFNDESVSHLSRFSRSVKASIGIDVSPALNLSIAQENQLVEAYVQRNASLITSLSSDMVKRVEQAVYDARLNRRTYKELTVELNKQFGIAQNRAALIAEDQLASLNSDFSRSRSLALGLDSYRWRSRNDSRVRKLHKSIEDSGRIFKWDEPTPAEGGLPPGKPIRCRCNSVSIVPANPATVERQRQLESSITRSNAEATRRDRATNRRPSSR